MDDGGVRLSILVSLIALIGIATTGLATTEEARDLTTALNRDPVAQHGDRIVEDTDGDGRVSVSLYDIQSEDPDEQHESIRDLDCELDGTTRGPVHGIDEWLWMNATKETEDSLLTAENYISNTDPSGERSFGLGTWKIALRVEDRCGARDWTNFTLEVVPDAVSLYEGDGRTDGNWTLTGAWTQAGSCPRANDAYDSGPPYLAFAQTAQDRCSYDPTKDLNGSAVLEADLSKPEATGGEMRALGVRFEGWWDTGQAEFQDLDRMALQASFDGGTTWIGSDLGSRGCGSDANDSGANCWDDDSWELNSWFPHTSVFEIPDPADPPGEVLLRWRFESFPPLVPFETIQSEEEPAGWYIDDVEVVGLKASSR